MHKPFATFALFVFGFSVSAQAQQAPIAMTTAGAVQGVTVDGIDTFKGIPYAAPPVGNLRWRPAQPVTKWSGTRDASDFGTVCPQRLFPGYNKESLGPRPMGEDCLTLNVWSPKATPSEAKPVMVWILPGSFTLGDGGMPGYSGRALAEDDVVAVTFNYRLGYLGQFAHPALAAKSPADAIGNYYLSDQVAALKWVRENIAQFGGDPENVTIFGMSAGGVSVNYLMGLPAAKGLFHKAASQSSNVRPYKAKHISQSRPMSPSLETTGLALADEYSIEGSKDDITKALRALSWEQILTYQNKTAFGSLNPVIDGTYLPEGLGPVFSEGRQHAVPYLTGATSWEGSLLADLSVDITDLLLNTLGITRSEIQGLYGDVDDRTIINNIQFDTFFGSQRWLARQHAKAGLPTYLYRFDYVYEAERGTIPGARHGEETPFVFKTLGHRVAVDISGKDWDMSDLVSGYWVAFAKTGNPNGAGRPNWPTHTASQDVLLNFDNDGITPKVNFEQDRMQFFEQRYDSGEM